MRRIESIGNLDGQVQEHVRRQRSILQAIGERLTFQVFDDEEVDSILVSYVVQRADVGM